MSLALLVFAKHGDLVKVTLGVYDCTFNTVGVVEFQVCGTLEVTVPKKALDLDVNFLVLLQCEMVAVGGNAVWNFTLPPAGASAALWNKVLVVIGPLRVVGRIAMKSRDIV